MSSLLLRGGVVIWASFLFVIAGRGGGVSAASFTINHTVDEVDASPGDGICGTATGRCTLRAAVQETNALTGADSIVLPPGTYELRIQGAGEDEASSGDLDVTDELEIIGAGAALSTIDGGTGDRAFTVHPGASLYVSDLTVQDAGDILSLAGGFLNTGTLRVERSVLRNNEASTGGGIANIGTLTVTSSSFINNGAPGGQSSAGGIENAGGGSMELSDVEFRDNGAHFGGAILNGGIATLTRVTLDGNTGLLAPGILNGGSMAIMESTLSEHQGRAILNESDGTLVVGNSTISANGIGIDNIHTADTSLLNVTVSGNARYGIFNDNGPLPNQTVLPTITVTNSIIAGNGEADCVDTNPDLESAISAGHNLSSGGTCPFNAAGDIMNTDPLLGPLADNGGPTQSHALLAGSPAIDAGDNAACPTADQRGVERPLDGDADGVPTCDIGAYEAPGAPGGTPSPAPTPSAEPTPTPGPAASVSPAPAPAGLPRSLPATGGRPDAKAAGVAGLPGMAAAAMVVAAAGWALRSRAPP